MSTSKPDPYDMPVPSDESDYELDGSDQKPLSPLHVSFYMEEQRNHAVMPNTGSDAIGSRPQRHYNPEHNADEFYRNRRRERNRRCRERRRQRKRLNLLHPGDIYPSTTDLYFDQRIYEHESDENKPVSVLRTEESIKPFSDEDLRRNGFTVPHVNEEKYTNPFEDCDGYRTMSSSGAEEPCSVIKDDGCRTISSSDAEELCEVTKDDGYRTVPSSSAEEPCEVIRDFDGNIVTLRNKNGNNDVVLTTNFEDYLLSNGKHSSTSESSELESDEEVIVDMEGNVIQLPERTNGLAHDIESLTTSLHESIGLVDVNANILMTPVSESSDNEMNDERIAMNVSPGTKNEDDKTGTINDPSTYHNFVDGCPIDQTNSPTEESVSSTEDQNQDEQNSTRHSSAYTRASKQELNSLIHNTALFFDSRPYHNNFEVEIELFPNGALSQTSIQSCGSAPLPDVPQHHTNMCSIMKTTNIGYVKGVPRKIIRAQYLQYEWENMSSEFLPKGNSARKYPMAKDAVEQESISSTELQEDDLAVGQLINSPENGPCAEIERVCDSVPDVQEEQQPSVSDSFDSEDVSASDSDFSSLSDDQNKNIRPYHDLHESSGNSELIDFSSFLTQPRSDEIVDVTEQRDPLQSETLFSSLKNEARHGSSRADEGSLSVCAPNVGNTSMLTGFTTANRKKIYVNEDSMLKMTKKLEQGSQNIEKDLGVSMNVFDEENIFDDTRMKGNAQVKVSVMTDDCVFSEEELNDKSKEVQNEKIKRMKQNEPVDVEDELDSDQSGINGNAERSCVKEVNYQKTVQVGLKDQAQNTSDETDAKHGMQKGIENRGSKRNLQCFANNTLGEDEIVGNHERRTQNKQHSAIKYVVKEENGAKKVDIDDIVPIDRNGITKNAPMRMYGKPVKGHTTLEIQKNKNIEEIYTKNAPMRMYGKPVKGHTTLEIQKNKNIEEIYTKIVKKYRNQRKEWIDEQFKWAYLSCFRSTNLEKDIADRMEARRLKEYSILRRIIEGDDVCFKLMCLVIIKTGSSLELYDGFYSLLFKADKALQGRIVAQKLKVGDKIYVFNAELLTHEKDIFAIDGPAFQLHANSVMRVEDDMKLGYTKYMSFLLKFTNVDKMGGLVPAIEFIITKVVDDKVLIQCHGLKRAVNVDRLEEEVEHMKTLAAKHGIEDEFKLKRYCKLLIRDLHSCQEGIFTWWNIREEVKIGDKIRAISATIVSDTVGLHFNTINRSYVSKM